MPNDTLKIDTLKKDQMNAVFNNILKSVKNIIDFNGVFSLTNRLLQGIVYGLEKATEKGHGLFEEFLILGWIGQGEMVSIFGTQKLNNINR